MRTELKNKYCLTQRAFLCFFLLFLLGIQNVFALNCSGKIYVKPPSSWSEVYMDVGGQTIKGTIAPNSKWFVFNDWGSAPDFSFVNKASPYQFDASEDTTQWIDKSGFGIRSLYYSSTSKFSCDDLIDGYLYIFEDSTKSGSTVFSNTPPNTKYIHFLPPVKEEWLNSIPMITTDGFSAMGKPLNHNTKHCGWFTYEFFDVDPSNNVYFYRSDDPDFKDAIGANSYGNSELLPIPLGVLFDGLASDTLYFVSSPEKWTSELKPLNGFTTIAPDIEGKCSYTLNARIYDTAPTLHPSFSCWQPGNYTAYKENYKFSLDCIFGAQNVPPQQALTAISKCEGVRQGLVQQILGDDKKPKLSDLGEECFINQTFFDQLFRPTAGVNEMTFTELTLTRNKEGNYEFDSDYYTSPGALYPGGYYPVEITNDIDVLAADPSQTPLPEARSKLDAAGPVFYCSYYRETEPNEGFPRIDILCNGPGWTKGFNCEGLFFAGAPEFYERSRLFGWDCPSEVPKDWLWKGLQYNSFEQNRWSSSTKNTGGGTNQHFCFESHANFTYTQGQRFAIRGDDDIWVFIDNKLAVDVGGMHLSTPGYVDLDYFGIKSGMHYGQNYDIDIFFCDRRTNMKITTNIFLKNGSGPLNTMQPNVFSITPIQDKTSASTKFELCYGNDTFKGCGKDLPLYYQPLKYYITHDGEEFAEFEMEAVYFGGIELDDFVAPIVSYDKIKKLDTGKYVLYITTSGGATHRITSFEVTANGIIKLPNHHSEKPLLFASKNRNLIVYAPNSGKLKVFNTLGQIVGSYDYQKGTTIIQGLKAGTYIIEKQLVRIHE